MIGNIDIFGMASARIKHASERHSLIASNIAHADTPQYVGKDLKAFSVENNTMRMRATHQRHHDFDASIDKFKGLNQSLKQAAFDQTINKNKVTVEEEIVKAAEAQSSFKLATGIMTKSMDLFMSVIDSRR